MSSFFSLSGKSANSSSASSLRSNKSGKSNAREAPPETTEIFTTPPEGMKPAKKWTYDEAQLAQIEELKKYTATLVLPKDDPYHPWEQRFLADPGCHPRYMRAAKWKMDDAKRRIKGTIEWRREYKPELISPEDVGVEAETGKIIISGFDNDARPIIYMRPGRENTETSPRQVRHLIFCLERGLDLMPAGQEQYCIIIDYKSATSQSNPSVSTGIKVLGILQNHYVERLGRGLIVNSSWLVNMFFTGISPFMDPITRDKIRSNPNLLELVPSNQLDWEFGGDYHLKFDYPSYWETLTKFCRLAPDGTRVDTEGKPWIPPAGNGIQAAVEGLVPTKDAVATGQVAHDPEAAAAGAPSSTAEPASTESQKIASAHGAADGKALEDIENGVAGVGINGIDADVPRTATSPPPNVRTKSGAPMGEVTFDHPPTAEEKEEMRRSMDIRA